MIIHVVFQVVVLLMGLTLMVLALRFDVELLEKCPELYNKPSDLTTTREASRVILAMGTLMFSCALTVMVYSFMMANAQASRLKNPTYGTILVYLVFVLLAGIIILAASSFIQSGVMNNCSKKDEIKKYISGFWWVGGLTSVLSFILLLVLMAMVPKTKTDKGKSWQWGKRTGVDRTKTAELSEEEGLLQKRIAEAKVISENAKKKKEKEIAEKKAEETKKENSKKQIDNYIEFNSKAMKYKNQAKEQIENYIETVEKQYPQWKYKEKTALLELFDKQYNSFCKDKKDSSDGKVDRDIVKQSCEGNVGKTGDKLVKSYQEKVNRNLKEWYKSKQEESVLEKLQDKLLKDNLKKKKLKIKINS